MSMSTLARKDLVWGAGVKDKDRKGKSPSAKYSKLSEQARKLIAGETQCAMFCGGAKCKYCTVENWKPEQMVIDGLYSEWVTDNILATARPSNYGFENHRILEQFVENNIKTVINLQQPGEHASCGHGNDPNSGFSYNPQRLMEKDIFFYNFAWQDYGIAPMSTLLDIVKVMQFAVSMGKVAIHCHAGLGRTGLLIACYLVFNNREGAGQAVNYVRSRRKGSIQTSQQVQTVFDFERHLKPFRTVFPSKVKGETEVSFKHFLNRQNHMLHGFEARRLKHIPKVVYVCCERLLELGGKGHTLSNLRLGSTTPTCSTPSSPSPTPTHYSATPNSHGKLKSCLSQTTVRSHDDDLGRSNDLDGSSPPEDLQKSGVLHCSVSLEDLADNVFKNVLLNKEDDTSSTGTGLSSESRGGRGNGNAVKNKEDSRDDDDDDDDDDCIVCGKPEVIVTPSSTPNPDDATEDGAVPRRRKIKKKGIGERLKERSRNRQKEVQTGESLMANAQTEQDTSNQKEVQTGESLTGFVQRETQTDDRTVASSKGKKEEDRTQAGNKAKNEEDNRTANSSTADKTNDHEDRSSVGSKPDTLSLLTTDSMFYPPSGNPEMLVRVCEALAETEYSHSVREKADHIERQLNETDSAWNSLAHEEDPCVLSAIFWDWLDQLKEPVLRRQELTEILERADSPRECLHHVEKSVKNFIEYQARVVSKLLPQAQPLEICLIERLLSHLTHSTVLLDAPETVSQLGSEHWGEMKSNDAHLLIKFFLNLVDEVGEKS